MNWLYKLWIVPVYFQCIWIIFHGKQVRAYHNDGLYPVKVDLSVWEKRDSRVAIRDIEELADEDRPNIYICEEPPNLLPVVTEKFCNYRNIRFQEQVYRWVAGRGCLLFIPNFLYVAGFNNISLSASCIYENWFAPCLEIVKDDGTWGCFPFDPSFEEVTTIVRNSLVPSARGRWERCFDQACDCCSHYMKGETNVTDGNKCETTFDGWTCWPVTDAGVVAQEICSEFAYSNTGPTCDHFSYKECYSNGSWEVQTDYSTCSVATRLLRRYNFHIAVLSVSIATCVPAIFIFFFYKRLRITRVALHRNLLIAIVVRNTLAIITRSVVYVDELTNAGDTVMTRNSVACRILAVAERIAANAVFVCMLVEAIYLHRLIVAVFRRKLNIKWLYGIGTVVAVLPAAVWAIVMSLLNDHSCWVVYTVEHIQWALDAPRIAILLVNMVLFIDVLRVLVTKIRNSENANQLSTVKASLFLLPIFGIQFIFTVVRPNTTNCNHEEIYYFVAYSIEGLQGFIVAMLFCYINKEVNSLVKATYKKTESAVASHVRSAKNHRMSLDPISDRRLTFSTGLHSNMVDVKDQYATIKPKLHVAEIISIQASERLAEILDPVYETIEQGYCNEGYDRLERSDVDNDSGFIPNKHSKVDEYYGFTNASSISIGCPDWISSPAGTIDNSSFDGHEERQFTDVMCNKTKATDVQHNETNLTFDPDNLEPEYNDIEFIENQKEDNTNNKSDIDSEYEDCENMLDEIMQYIEINDNKNIKLNPDLLAPNRKEDDKIIFVEE